MPIGAQQIVGRFQSHERILRFQPQVVNLSHDFTKVLRRMRCRDLNQQCAGVVPQSDIMFVFTPINSNVYLHRIISWRLFARGSLATDAGVVSLLRCSRRRMLLTIQARLFLGALGAG